MNERSPNSCLIFGPSGIGKSTLVKDLRQRDKIAFDADDTPGLSDWYTLEGEAVPWQYGREWRTNHYFYWNQQGFKTLLAEQSSDSTFYVAGVSQNLEQFAPWFRHVVFLEASADTIVARRRDPQRYTPYPYEHLDEDTDRLREYVTTSREKAIDLGAIIINAELDTATISEQIIAAVEH